MRRTIPFLSLGPKGFETAPGGLGDHSFRRVHNYHLKSGEKQMFDHLFNTDHVRTSFWASDYKHKYLVKHGKDHQGPVPPSPAPGTFQELSPEHSRLHLGGHPVPSRETRRLPLMPVTSRSFFEHKQEATLDFQEKTRKDRLLLKEARELEFHNWYKKVQQVRGRWCRDNNVTSRGNYGRAVDAAEYWD